MLAYARSAAVLALASPPAMLAYAWPSTIDAYVSLSAMLALASLVSLPGLIAPLALHPSSPLTLPPGRQLVHRTKNSLLCNPCTCADQLPAQVKMAELLEAPLPPSYVAAWYLLHLEIYGQGLRIDGVNSEELRS